jgi:hypothetical protein
MTHPRPSSTAVTSDLRSRTRLWPQTVLAELARLTERDRWILQLLDQHKVFTTEQLTDLAFGSLGRARNRLSTLHQRQVLDRFRLLVRPGSASWRWSIGPVGAAILAASHDQPPPRPHTVREATTRLATNPQLDHLLGVNGFFTTLYAYARAHPHTRLVRWWSETHTRHATADLVRPDGHGLWQEHDRQTPFWLEYDRGTETLRRVLVGKLADYAHLADTQWAYPLLFWLPTRSREANLHTELARAGIPAGLVVATATTEHAQPRGGPAGPVWQLPGRHDRLRLADLPSPAGMADTDTNSEPGSSWWDG